MAGVSPTRFWVVTVAPLVSVIVPSYLLGTLAVSMGAELQITATTLGVLTAVRFVTAALTSAAMGRLAERSGAAVGLRLAALTVALASAAVALLVRDIWLLGVMLAFCGCALALVQPSADLWVARGIPPNRQGLAFGVKQAAIPAAAMLAGLSVPLVLENFGWRWVWAAAAMLAAVSAVVVPFGPGESGTRRPSGVRRPPRRMGPLLLLATCFALGSVAVTNVTVFLVLAMVDDGIPESRAGVLFAIASVMGIVARLVIGRLADRTTMDLLILLAIIQTMGALVFFAQALTGGAWYYVLAPLAFAVALGWPGILMLAVVRSHPEQPAGATSIVNVGAYLGSVAGPISFGLVVSHWDFATGWGVTAVCLLLAAGAAVVGRVTLRRPPPAVLRATPSSPAGPA